ncbi:MULTISPECIES: glycoside hydrolase family 30 beta sandwich domain-containing protein [unclassified Leeuwenhoekiella]|uniref:glycoside hydrolase family 30 protein n=1 Tax=unclassified Leeuwenhoekiella TaxID=2615029 RepID=UPI0025C298BC|nr:MULTISPECIES: glycoside hydrolase family 30 beta sandwich domain-containing protein [unclassified Leeuwenhoekiella]
MKLYKLPYLTLLMVLALSCSSSSSDEEVGQNPQPPSTPEEPSGATNEMDFWLTKGNRSTLLEKQAGNLVFGTTPNSYATLDVDASKTYQTIDGFGFSLTGGSAQVISALPASEKQNLLQELFGNGAGDIGISYLRISVGASNLNEAPFTYDDVPAGETDEDLSEFSLEKDRLVIDLLKEILNINPDIKIMASPWTAPVWMKDNGSFVGGSLKPEYYEVYANYWVKYLNAMQAEGITIDALTPQNEPLHGGNNPSMEMSALEQANFIKNNLGPAIESAGINTKIVIYDHNCDNPGYPISILNDTQANAFVDGSAFHLYAGDIAALTTVHNAFPAKNVYFTEQYNSSQDEFGGTLKWHLKNVIIGSMRNWSKNALEWNLANDAGYGPHTDGGCTVCKGALTINGSQITRNVGYYIVAHASKFVPEGSIRIESPIKGELQSVAFIRPDGKKVLIVENDGATNLPFNIKYSGKWLTTSLDAGAVGTYIWD